MRCERSGQRGQQVHDTSIRRVWDLQNFGHLVVLVVPRRRMWCEHCHGPQLELLNLVARYRRVTGRLAAACSRLLRSTTVQTVADFYELGWPTVKSIDMTTAYTLEIRSNCPNA